MKYFGLFHRKTFLVPGEEQCKNNQPTHIKIVHNFGYIVNILKGPLFKGLGASGVFLLTFFNNFV